MLYAYNEKEEVQFNCWGFFPCANQAHPAALGGHRDLPFLFKVLSIRKALSIQVSPAGKQAGAFWEFALGS